MSNQWVNNNDSSDSEYAIIPSTTDSTNTHSETYENLIVNNENNPGNAYELWRLYSNTSPK